MSTLPPIDACFAAMADGSATVTVPSGTPVETSIAWGPSRNTELAVGNAGVFDTMPTLAIKLSASLPRVPKGTRVECPPMGGETVRVWIVREVYEVDPEVAIVGVA